MKGVVRGVVKTRRLPDRGAFAQVSQSVQARPGRQRCQAEQKQKGDVPILPAHVDRERQRGQQRHAHAQSGPRRVTPPPVPFRQLKRRGRQQPPEERAERARHKPEAPDVIERPDPRRLRSIFRLIRYRKTQRHQQAQNDHEPRERQRESINLAEPQIKQSRYEDRGLRRRDQKSTRAPTVLRRVALRLAPRFRNLPDARTPLPSLRAGRLILRHMNLSRRAAALSFPHTRALRLPLAERKNLRSVHATITVCEPKSTILSRPSPTPRVRSRLSRARASVRRPWNRRRRLRRRGVCRRAG